MQLGREIITMGHINSILGQADMIAGHRNSTMGQTGMTVGHNSGSEWFIFAWIIRVANQNWWVCLVGQVSPPEAIYDTFLNQATLGKIFACVSSINIRHSLLSFVSENLSKIRPKFL